MLRFVILATSLAFGLCQAAVAERSPEAAKAQWLYVVKTKPSRPELETQFNAWYDNIDIPDVLAVKGFERARRAVGVNVPAGAGVGLKSDDGKYVALYDIATKNIDKTIVDMYVAARKMSALDRSTDALKVVEANYYLRLDQAQFDSSASGGQRYVFVQKILCCRTPSERSAYRRWFMREQGPKLQANGIARMGLYELYRVMEEVALDADEIPHLLALYEFDAATAEEAMALLTRSFRSFSASGRDAEQFPIRDSILYSQMSERTSNRR